MITHEQLLVESTVLDDSGNVYTILNTEHNKDMIYNKRLEEDGARLDVVSVGGGFVVKRLVAQILERAEAVDSDIEEKTTNKWRWSRAGAEWFGGYSIRVLINGPSNGFYTWNGWACPAGTADDIIECMTQFGIQDGATYTCIDNDGGNEVHMLRIDAGSGVETFTFDGKTIAETWEDGDDRGGSTHESFKVTIDGETIDVWSVPGPGSWTWDIDEPNYDTVDMRSAEPGMEVDVDNLFDDGITHKCYLIDWVDKATYARVVTVEAWDASGLVAGDIDSEKAAAWIHTVNADEVMMRV